MLKHIMPRPGKDEVNQPPSGGCVLKQYLGRLFLAFLPSRLQAAVC